MFSEAKVTEIYCLADDFCKEFSKYQEKHMFSTSPKNGKHRNKPNRMSDAEIMFIMILFHPGGYLGFKLHLIINDKGEILNFMFTAADVDDREPLKQGSFLNNIKGKLCADKGYIGKTLQTSVIQ